MHDRDNVRGGQGRRPEEVEDSAAVFLVCAAAFAALVILAWWSLT